MGLNIAIIRLSSLGDIVFSTPVARWLKILYPDSKITWFIDYEFASLLEFNPFIDSVVKLKLREIKKTKNPMLLVSQIKLLRSCEEFDFVIDLQGLLKSALIASFLRGKKIGFDYKSAREGVASLFYDVKLNIDYNLNVQTRYQKLIEMAFGKFQDKNLPAIYANFQTPMTFGAVLINIGASRPNKRYPHFESVINAMQDEVVFLIWGNDSEYEIASELAGKTDAKLLPKLSIYDLKSAISSSALVIGGDSGVTHMAWGLGTPSITIFGATPSWRNCVAGEDNIIIDALDVTDAKKLDYNDFAIASVPPSKIIDAYKKILMV